jgi:hypothetical protein
MLQDGSLEGFFGGSSNKSNNDGLVDGLPGTGVIEHRPAHALDRLLRPVNGFGVS